MPVILRAVADLAIPVILRAVADLAMPVILRAVADLAMPVILRAVAGSTPANGACSRRGSCDCAQDDGLVGRAGILRLRAG